MDVKIGMLSELKDRLHMTDQPDLPDPPKTKKSLKDHLQALVGAAFIVLITLLLIEVVLRVVDPWGMSYFDDLERMGNEIFETHPERGFIIPDGHYSFSYWSTTIEDGMRITPDTNMDADCHIIILGDSVAHGFGVEDEETWVNQIAQHMSDVNISNLGIPRYSSTNILGTFQAFPDADAYLYLIIQNDIEDAINPTSHVYIGAGNNTSQIVRYVNFGLRRGSSSQVPIFLREETTVEQQTQKFRNDPRLSRLLNEIQQIDNDERVTLVAFREKPLTTVLLENDLDIGLLDYPPYRISFADEHLNVQGNRELAEQLLPVVQKMRDTHCVT